MLSFGKALCSLAAGLLLGQAGHGPVQAATSTAAVALTVSRTVGTACTPATPAAELDARELKARPIPRRSEDLPGVSIGKDTRLLQVLVHLPAGHYLSSDADSSVLASASGVKGLSFRAGRLAASSESLAVFEIPLKLSPPKDGFPGDAGGCLTLFAYIHFANADGSRHYWDSVKLEMPLNIFEGGPYMASVSFTVPDPEASGKSGRP